jgi:asparaginyl-tRNA synthetase
MVSIKKILEEVPTGKSIVVQGWVKTKRVSKRVVFISLQDGSCGHALQVVGNPETFSEDLLRQVTTGASLSIRGQLVPSLGQGQAKEVALEAIEVLGKASADYPLQPKRHSLSFLRSIQHLRMRSNTFGAIFRIRHALSYAIHTFFHKRGFFWLHTPIITRVDAEGAGEVFGLTSGTGNKTSATEFFGEKVSLTVSGQLAGEAGAMGLGKIYTFGPTFRAEKSNTTRHLAEFWMVEPEMAFYDLKDTVDLGEALLHDVIGHVLLSCDTDLAFLEEREAKERGVTLAKPLRERLQDVIKERFVRLSYSDAIDL